MLSEISQLLFFLTDWSLLPLNCELKLMSTICYWLKLFPAVWCQILFLNNHEAKKKERGGECISSISSCDARGLNQVKTCSGLLGVKAPTGRGGGRSIHALLQHNCTANVLHVLFFSRTYTGVRVCLLQDIVLKYSLVERESAHVQVSKYLIFYGIKMY